MKGRVVFWYHLEPLTSSGYVFFKLYGQQCVRCHNGTFEHAMWYPEEVIKVSRLQTSRNKVETLIKAVVSFVFMV